jgi:hypothetical protein
LGGGGGCRCGSEGGRELLLNEGEAVGGAALGGITRVHEIGDEKGRRGRNMGGGGKDLKRLTGWGALALFLQASAIGEHRQLRRMPRPRRGGAGNSGEYYTLYVGEIV